MKLFFIPLLLLSAFASADCAVKIGTKINNLKNVQDVIRSSENKKLVEATGLGGDNCLILKDWHKGSKNTPDDWLELEHITVANNKDGETCHIEKLPSLFGTYPASCKPWK
ncbi:hypothetical protein KIF53_15400 [Chromobacterium subtsugae]|uniref:Uncharacterized protein n=1 Tax=Chromobacterium subtsugae TaxID=251747 RepID=A0ABS7FI86_9NEIS|nr:MULTISPECIES: hypothetical protein [Chromobacterium]MBW7567792.1 hypothetical protein [Chromobacterium subtsugae]MBW8289018.1 hypothetical protein [Chromobacterium subtsugae]WSE93837.1 hypothetical protein U6115_11495 [Chromobacterium subtsugae]WVH62214.1 hypothetical protein U6151_11515 [Chromobacterium subtsugae]